MELKEHTLTILVLFLMLFVSIGSVSALENSTDDISENEVIEVSESPEILTACASDDAVGVSSDENIISSDNRGWYVNASAADGGDGSNITPYKNFKSVLDNMNLQDGDSVYFAGGENYTGDGINVNLQINKQLNLLKYGSGEAVFDAQHNSRIFRVSTTCINITGLTFVNGKASWGGAIYFEYPISNSNINATYINNTVTDDGGANYFSKEVSDSNIGGTYTNNPAEDHGGANSFMSIVSGSNITGTYTNNTAGATGGANYFKSDVLDSNVAGTYANNKAICGGANYLHCVSGSNVTGTYTNNTARDKGGANYFNKEVSDSNVTGTYTNNTVMSIGGANFFNGEVLGCNVTGTYTNNTAVEAGANRFNIEVSGSNVTGTYTNNTAAYGGANSFSSVSGSNVAGTYTNNTATSGRGGANSFATVSDSNVAGTYTNNTARDKGGANYFNIEVSGSNVTGTYTNNNATSGGANYFNIKVSGSNVTGTYTNNNATSGGANYFNKEVSDSNVTGTYTGNTAKQYGGAIFLCLSTDVVVSGCVFVNNSAENGIFYFDNGEFDSNLAINDNIFLNNDGVAIYFVKSDSTSNADYNWFGNNATNYDVAPTTYNVEINDWLFLNAITDPASISVYESSDILFKLYSYGSSGVSDYDNSKLPVVNLTVTANNGDVDKDTIVLGDSVVYTPDNVGESSVTASIENAEYTIVFNVGKSDSVLFGDNLEMSYKDGSAWTVTLTDGTNPIEGAAVKVGILGKTYSLTTDADGTVSLPVNVAPGTYDVNATFETDENYESAFVNATVTVNKAVSTLTAKDLTMAYRNGSWIVTLTGAEGVIPKAGIKFGILGKVYTIVTDENGVASLPINLAPGTYEVNATFAGNYKHESSFVNATVTVEKSKVNIDSENLTMCYKDGSEYAVTVTDANGAALAGTTVKFTFGTKSYSIKTDANGVAALPINLNVGEYTVNAIVDDARYVSEEATNTITVTDYDVVPVASDINMTYQDGTNYEVQLTTSDGTPFAVADLVVKITILSKTYSIKTDAEGIAKLPINLKAGTYVFTAEYNGSQINSTVVVNKA